MSDITVIVVTGGSEGDENGIGAVVGDPRIIDTGTKVFVFTMRITIITVVNAYERFHRSTQKFPNNYSFFCLKSDQFLFVFYELIFFFIFQHI